MSTFNILKDPLQPTTFGQQVDALIIANIRMWHAQEILFDLDALNALSKDGMYSTLKYATWLNLERNVYMDGTDGAIVEHLAHVHPSVKQQVATTTNSTEVIWENC